MEETRFKSFYKSNIDKTIKRVEFALFEGDSSSVNSFIEVDKLRYINVKAYIKSYIDKIFRMKSPLLMKLIPFTIKKNFILIYRFFFQRINFQSTADVIHIRNNLSLFYLNRGYRVKIYLEDGVRSIQSFKNEYNIRKNNKPMINLLNVPRLMDANIDNEPSFYTDEIVFGNMYNWNDKRVDAMLMNIFQDMWKFYEANGIKWVSLSERGIVTTELVSKCKEINRSDLEPDIDVELIMSFSDRLIPVSLIHGDFSPGNIIDANGKNYVIDWEMAEHDLIVKDFYKILLKKYECYDCLDALMSNEIAQQFGSKKDKALTLYEQILMEYLLRKISGKNTPSLSPFLINHQRFSGGLKMAKTV